MLAAIFILLLLIGVPVAVVLGLSASIYILLTGNTVLFQSYIQQLFSATENYGLLAIPLYMLVGELMNSTGITQRLIRASAVAVGMVRGGLAYVNLFANTLVASIVGSAAAQISLMSQIMVPEMVKHGYRKDFAAATTAAGGLLSPIIPPSMLFIIYGVLAQVSIGDMFLAGIIPGLLMAVGFVATVRIIGLKQALPKSKPMSRPEKINCLLEGVPAAFVPGVIIFSILSGLATPTEAAAIAVAVTCALGRWRYKQLDLRLFWQAVQRAGMTASIILIIIATAGLFGWVLIFEQLPQQLAHWIESVTHDPFTFLIMINLMLLIIGALIDGIPAMIMLVPVLLPIATEIYGIDPFQFGVILSINLVLGLLTPPVGTGLYIVSGMSNVPPMNIFKALFPFLLSTMIILILLSWQPGLITLFL